MNLDNQVDVRLDLWNGASWSTLTDGWNGPIVPGGPTLMSNQVTVRASGRSDWASQVSPGSCSFVLDNTSGALSPTTPSYPEFKVGGRIRVRARWAAAGAYEPIGTGEIVRLTYDWPSGDHESASLVTVEIAGQLSKLRRDKGQVLSPLRRGLPQVMFPSSTGPWPVMAYWPMEGHGRDVVGNYPGVSPMTFGGGTSFNGTGLLGSEPVLTFPAGEPAGFRVSGPLMRPTPLWTGDGRIVAALVKVGDFSGLAAGNTELLTIGLMASSTLVRLWMRNTGVLRCSVADHETGVEAGTANSVSMPSSEWCVVWIMTQKSGFGTNVNFGWFPIAGGDGDSGSWAELGDPGVLNVEGSVRAISRTGRRDLNVRTDISIGHLMLAYGDWGGDVSVYPEIFRPMANAHVGEQARARIVRVSSESPYFGPVADVACLPSSPEMDTARCGPQPIAASIDIIEEAAEVGQAVLVEHSDDLGLDCMFPESWYNADPAVTLDAEADEISIPFSLSVDIQTDNGGTSANVADDWSSENLDSWLDHLAENPVKSPTVTVTDWPANFDGGAPGDMFEVSNLPAAQLAQRDMTFRTEQVTHTLTRSKWVSTINTSSAEPWQGIGVWDDSGSRWDHATSVLWADIDASVSGLTTTSAVDDGLGGWDPAGGYLVQIDDEIIRIDSIWGGSPPNQVWNVTRAMNGTTAAPHTAGTPVHIYPAVRWAY